MPHDEVALFDGTRICNVLNKNPYDTAIKKERVT
jgi:hypothetical protein